MAEVIVSAIANAVAKTVANAVVPMKAPVRRGADMSFESRVFAYGAMFTSVLAFALDDNGSESHLERRLIFTSALVSHETEMLLVQFYTLCLKAVRKQI